MSELKPIWLEDPSSLPFVRVHSEPIGRRGTYPKSRVLGHNYRVVGFLDGDAYGFLVRDRLVRDRAVFTVRDYDMAPADGGFVPSEGVDPLDLHGESNCHEGSFPRVPEWVRRRRPPKPPTGKALERWNELNQ